MAELIRLTRDRIGAKVVEHEGDLRLDIAHDDQVVMSIGQLGFVSSTLSDDVVVVGIDEREVVEEYSARTGKQVGRRVRRFVEADLSIESASGHRFVLRVRVGSDGVGFRFRVPGGSVITGERTRFDPAVTSRAWVLEYTTWYEAERIGADLPQLPIGDYGMPLLLRTGDNYALVTEGDIDGHWSGSHLHWDGAGFAFEPADSEVPIEADRWSPWRIVIVGQLSDVVASTLVEDVARPAPANLVAAEWIRPGRGAWSWWSSQYSGADADLQLRWAEYAGERGWEHLLVDCGWSAAWVPELVRHASAHGVQVHLWSKWSDLVGRDLAKLALWKSWGIAGIKVDFMESESRERHSWYDAIIAECARLELMINFHGSTIPRGWSRSQPHVMTHEAIRGAEYYTFMGEPLRPAHNVIQPFTRNVIGSMDYTPVTFTAPGRQTSDAHELALSVVYESSLMHFADSIEAYAERPIAEALLQEVPSIWDETRLLDGDPDTFAAIARRRGDRWFVGVLSAGEPRALELDLTALTGASGATAMWLIEDGKDCGLRSREITEVPTTLELALGRHGGAVAVLAPTREGLRSAQPNPVREDLELEPALQTVRPGGTARVTATFDRAPGEAVELRVPPGWAYDLVREDTSEAVWEVRAPADVVQGSVAVVTVGLAARDAPRRFADARLQAPFAEGSTGLSALTPTYARNGYGPVEVDSANGGGDPDDGGPLSVLGVTYASGLGVCAPSRLDFAVDGCRRFTALVGVDDETPDAEVCFEIWADDALLTSVVVHGSRPPIEIDVDIRAAAELSLRTTGGEGGAQGRHGDWIAPTVHR